VRPVGVGVGAGSNVEVVKVEVSTLVVAVVLKLVQVDEDIVTDDTVEKMVLVTILVRVIVDQTPLCTSSAPTLPFVISPAKKIFWVMAREAEVLPLRLTRVF
jgi:hypothetical protein